MFAAALLLTALQWSAPDGCPQAAAVEQMVASMLADADQSPVPARASTVVVPGGYELTVEVGDQRRTLRSESCRELAGAAALIIAVAHDPIAVAHELEAAQTREPAPSPLDARVGTEPSPPATEPSPAPRGSTLPEATAQPADTRVASVTSVPASSADTPARRRPAADRERSAVPRSFAARPQLGLSLGVLARPRPAFAVGFAWIRGALRLEGAPLLVLPSTTTTERANARVWMGGAGARACWVPALGDSAAAELCAGGELAALRARGGGNDIRGAAVTQLWAAALGSAGLLVGLSERVGLGVRGDLLIALRQPGVHVDGVGPVFRAGPIGGRIWLGPEFRLP